MVQKQMSFKDISYLELWQPLHSAEWNHLCNFGRRYHEEQFCEIILNFDQWFRRKCNLKVFLILTSGSPFVQCSVTIFASLVYGIMRKIGSVVQEEMLFKRFLIWSSGCPPIWWREPFMKF